MAAALCGAIRTGSSARAPGGGRPQGDRVKRWARPRCRVTCCQWAIEAPRAHASEAKRADARARRLRDQGKSRAIAFTRLPWVVPVARAVPPPRAGARRSPGSAGPRRRRPGDGAAPGGRARARPAPGRRRDPACAWPRAVYLFRNGGTHSAGGPIRYSGAPADCGTLEERRPSRPRGRLHLHRLLGMSMHEPLALGGIGPGDRPRELAQGIRANSAWTPNAGPLAEGGLGASDS